MAAFAADFILLLRQRQPVDLDHVVEHPGEDLDDLVVLVPVETRVLAERVAHEAREIHRAQQAGAVRRKRLLAARVRGADVLAPPVAVHLVDAVDQHESRLGEVVGRAHDHVPHAPRGQGLVDLAEDEARLVAHVAVCVRPFTPQVLRRIGGIDAFDLLRRHGESELPLTVVAHRAHEGVGDEQREIELPQPAGLALGADEFHDVGVADVEGTHLRAAAAAGRRHREAHLVVDIHERQRAGRIGSGARHVRAARPQRRELVTDATARLEREPRLVDLAQDVVHRIADGSRHRAVDGRGRGLMLLRAGVRSHATRGNRTAPQRPEKPLVPVFADRIVLDIRKRARDALVGVVHGAIEWSSVLGAQSILLVPDVQGRFLEWNAAGVPGCKLHGGAHFGNTSPIRRSFIGK